MYIIVDLAIEKDNVESSSQKVSQFWVFFLLINIYISIYREQIKLTQVKVA